MKKRPGLKEISVDVSKTKHTIFKALCEANESNITDEIRGFIDKYINQHRGKLKAMVDGVADDRLMG